MNSNFNPNGQFNGWGQQIPPNYMGYQMPVGYNPFNNEYFRQQEEKKNDTKILKTIGMVCGISIIAYFVLSLLSGVVVALLSTLSHNMNALYEEGVALWAFSSIATVIFIGGPFLASYIYLKNKKMTGVLPLGTTYNKKASIYLVIAFLPLTLVSSFVINFISILIQSLMGIEFSSGMEEMSINGVGEFLLMTLFVAVIPAILEEVAIRGILLQPLRRYGDWFAIIVSSIIFSLLHGNMVQIPYTVLAGVYFGYVAVATGSIWPSIIMHFLNNFYSVLVTAFDSNLSVGLANVLTLGTLGLMVIAGVFAFIKYKSMNYKVTLAKGVKTLKTGEKAKTVFLNIPMIIAILFMLMATLTSISEA